MKLKKDIDIIESFLKKACKKVNKNEYLVQDNICVISERHINEDYIDNCFYPIKITFKKNGSSQGDKRLKLKNCYMEDKKGKTITLTEWVGVYAYGSVSIDYSIGEKDVQFDCLSFDADELNKYQIFRYY